MKFATLTLAGKRLLLWITMKFYFEPIGIISLQVDNKISSIYDHALQGWTTCMTHSLAIHL